MSDAPQQIRVLCDDPLDGPRNMARDEALLTRVGSGDSEPTLRLYQWNPPTMSLGYFQRFADYDALEPPAGRIDVVRRLTGGGAILHDREWTYSLALPVSHPLLTGNAARLYELVHDALIDTLSLLNVRTQRCGSTDDSSAGRGHFFCFDRRHCLDVLLDGQKLAGSAQRRTPQAVLQHGSIILSNRYQQHHVASITEHIDLDDQALLTPFIDSLEQRLDVKLKEGEWSENELARAEDLAAKYGGEKWTREYP